MRDVRRRQERRKSITNQRIIGLLLRWRMRLRRPSSAQNNVWNALRRKRASKARAYWARAWLRSAHGDPIGL